MKSLIAFLQVVLAEAGTRCGTSTIRDGKTVAERSEHEGISFLTMSLPNFCSDFERSLDQGFVSHDLFTGFSWTGGLPRFLGGFLDLVFDRSSGRLLDAPSVNAIQAVRQITLLLGKVSIRCTPEREDAAIAKYLECEKDVRQFDLLGLSEPKRLEEFSRIGRLLWAELFSNIDSRVYKEGVMPRHGPGATADKLRGNAKYNQLTWTRRLEQIFPHWEYLIPGHPFLDRMDGVTILEPGDERPVKVTLVPKTLKTPRIIAEEPTCMQYMQQGILAMIVNEISRSDNARHLIDMKSQQPNQRLAREGSISGTLATLDLSEASDRVSNQHVRLLLANHRVLRDAVDATRSLTAVMPDKKTVVSLAKFASMGSALCFPMESIVFMTVVFLGVQNALNRPLTMKDVRSLYGKVRVYGDDIIVPVDYVQSVTEALESFGFKINTKKSFWTGKFRESCGKEYYDGHEVTVARCRNLLPVDRRYAERIESAVSMRNQFFHLGYHDTVEFLDVLIGRVIPFPYVKWTEDENGDFISRSILQGRHSHKVRDLFGLPSQEYRYDDELQRPLVRGVVTSPQIPVSLLDDYGALMKHVLNTGDEPFVDRRHLQRAGRPGTVHIKTRWAPPF